MRGSVFLAAMVALLSSAAFVEAVTVYSPVQYQFGRHGEIFYGGTDPSIASNANAPGPQMLAGVYTNTSYSPLYFHPRFLNAPQTAIYSDMRPGVDVSQYGFTIDDARNEAYADAPRYIAGNPAAKAAENDYERERASEQTHAPLAPNYTPGTRDRRPDAIPLLTWAKAAHARGETALVNALLAEAAKDDPKATASVRAAFTSTPNK